MLSRFLASLAALVAFSLIPLVGQFLAANEPWSPPRNPDGHADLQGIWTNATWTPLERPVEFVRQWVGNSIGHWEGNALVVDTSKTRFRGTADKIYEYACHEGNYAMVDILRRARLQDKAEEEAAKKGSSERQSR